MHYGIDISDIQHPNGAGIDYAAAAADLRARGGGSAPFVIVNDQSANCGADLAGFKAHGAHVGVYHYGNPNESPITQAEHSLAYKLGVACDLETFGNMNATQIGVWINAFLGKVKGAGQPQLWYDDISVTEQESPSVHYPRWLAAPSYGPGQALPVACVCQQLAPGTVAGIQGQVDIDVWRGDEASFRRFFKIPSPIRKEWAEVKLPVYQRGQSGEGIKALQAALLAQTWGTNVAGFKANGHYDDATTETVKRFCAGHHISGDDGSRFGPDCWEALFGQA